MNKKINKRKQKLEKLSITDPLTKLFNRRYFDEIFDKEVSIARREKKLFCLMYFDIDNFKSYNDTYGHQMGDDVLTNISTILKSNMKRPSDYAFRMGGEEFAAIFSASFGVVYVDFTKNTNTEVYKKDLYKFVDDLLYKVKRKHKNRVIIRKNSY